MSTFDQRFWIVFNGEIYNYIELRDELKSKGYHFHTETDTEVILNAYLEWGENSVEHFNGMWSFSLWDCQRKTLFCARDRFGIKPFYYIWDGQTFAFASEIKALLSLPELARTPNNSVIYDYLSCGVLDHSSETFFEGIHQLPPSHTLSVKLGSLDIRRYWGIDLSERVELPDDSAYATKFLELFEDAVRIHLRSDVPIGTCLSGGLDLSSIVCMANRLLFKDKVVKSDLVGSQQKTFSSCFEDLQYDERKFIKKVLEATNAEANFTFPTVKKLIDDLPRLIWHQDEPFGSTSIFAQWCVMETVAQRGVTVLLDGQGADELLGGYHSYYNFYWSSLARNGEFTRLINEVQAYHHIYKESYLSLFMLLTRPFIPELIMKAARKMRRKGIVTTELGINPDFSRSFHNRGITRVNRSKDPIRNYLYDAMMHSSLPGLLHYEDRNSMAHSIEARVPFLDHRLVEYIFATPPGQIINGGLTKSIIRNAMKGILPEEIRLRTDKMGFVTPEKLWLSVEMKDMALDIFNSPSFYQRGYFDVPGIQKNFREHLSGNRDLTFIAWRWINLELWLRQMIDNK